MPDQQPPIGASALIRFVGELAMLAALGYTGAALTDGAIAVAAAIALPLAGIVLWGAFVAPRARRRLPDPARLLLELVLFGGAAAGLIATDHWILALVLTAAYVGGLPHRRAEASQGAQH